MTIVEKYINGLKKAYIYNNTKEIWNKFENTIHGANKEDISKLREIYPNIPDSLVELLEFVDGTYWRKYKDEKITFYFLGSDIEEYPYYLLSTRQIVENQNEAVEYYSDYVERAYEDIKIDERITNSSQKMKWVHFSDCMNNGGTSQLFIDFSPSKKGVSGQIIRYLHDPDEIQVIADSFDDYLQLLIDKGYDFINKDTVD